jgi:hypothetical protein
MNWVLIGGIAMVCSGCLSDNSGGSGAKTPPPYPHNLLHLHCKNHPLAADKVPVQVDLTHPQSPTLSNADDSIVFVCKDDTITWTPSDTNYSIEIRFTDSFAAELYGPNNSDLGPTFGPITSPKTLAPTNHPGSLFKYSLVIRDKTNNEVGRLDPHVIPMGN